MALEKRQTRIEKLLFVKARLVRRGTIVVVMGLARKMAVEDFV